MYRFITDLVMAKMNLIRFLKSFTSFKLPVHTMAHSPLVLEHITSIYNNVSSHIHTVSKKSVQAKLFYKNAHIECHMLETKIKCQKIVTEKNP